MSSSPLAVARDGWRFFIRLPNSLYLIMQYLFIRISLAFTCVSISLASFVYALDGGTLRLNVHDGWRAFEIISRGNDPSSDGYNWAMPSTFDGIGAWLPDNSTLQLYINHETSDATISEVNLNLANFQTAITNTINTGTPGGLSFVESARQAYDRWSNDAGASWTSTSDVTNTTFVRFCSSQSYAPNTFGPDRGFVDQIYITGEEGGTSRLFALDSVNRD